MAGGHGVPLCDCACPDAEMTGQSGGSTDLLERRLKGFVVCHADRMQIICTQCKQENCTFSCIARQRRDCHRRSMVATVHKRRVGSRLRIAFEAIEKKQADISRLFPDATPSKIGNWLRGDDYPNEWFLVRFCDRFNISMDWIYRGRVSVAMDTSLADALWAAEQALPQDPEEAGRPAA